MAIRDENEVGPLSQLSGDAADVLEVLGDAGSTTEEAKTHAREILSGYQDRMGDYEPEEGILERMRRTAEETQNVLRQARKRLVDINRVNPGDKWLALAATLGQPTRTGRIGEEIGRAFGSLSETRSAERERENQLANSLLEIDTMLANSGSSVDQAEMDLMQMRRELEADLAQEALKTLGRRTGASGSGGTREAKIQDLMAQGLDRATSSGMVDGFIRIEVVPQTGMARLVNEVDSSVQEVPLGTLGQSVIDEYSGAADGASAVPEHARGPDGQDLRTEEERLADELVRVDFGEGRSLWDMAELGTGPWSTFQAGASIPSSWFGGPVATETIGARQGLRIRARDMARAMVDNPRMPVRLIEMAIEDAAMAPAILDSPEAMRSRMASLDAELWDRYLDAREDAANPNLPQDLRSAQSANSRAIYTFLRDLAVPEDQLQRRLREADPALQDVPEGVSPEDWSYLTEAERRLWLGLDDEETE